LRARLGAAILVLWPAAAVACSVSSIDVVLSLLGSSLSIALSYLIPCAAYRAVLRPRVDSALACPRSDDEDCEANRRHQFPPHGDDLSRHPGCSSRLAGALIAAFVPLMVASFANAVYNTFVLPKL
jgi:hypothetical protein